MRSHQTACICFCVLLLLCCFFQSGALARQPFSAAEADYTQSGILRLHVIANSDEEKDQSAKLAVRDAVLPLLKSASSEAEAEEMVLSLAPQILQTARQALQEQGCDYDAQLLLGDFSFPCREYEQIAYPAGKYRALRIVLGRGQGHNWWCVLFPPLCLGSFAPQQGDEVVVESTLLNWIRSWRNRS